MKKAHILNGNEKNLVFSVCVGIAVAIIISTILSVGLTFLVQSGRLNESNTIGVFVIRVVSIFIGVLIATVMSANKLLPIAVIIAAGYLFILMGIAILFLDGTIKQIWSGVFSVAIGASAALIIKLKPKANRKKSFRFKK